MNDEFEMGDLVEGQFEGDLDWCWAEGHVIGFHTDGEPRIDWHVDVLPNGAPINISKVEN